MSEKRGGHVCAVKNCKNKRYNCDKSFFSFPSDPNRAKIWIMKCHREDLLENLNNVDKSSRLCEDHFEPRMFTNHLRNRLNKNAVPTLFPSLEGSSKDFSDHTYSQPMLVTSDLNILQDKDLCQTDVSENNPETEDGCQLEMEQELNESCSLRIGCHDITNVTIDTSAELIDRSASPSLISPTSSTQTSIKLSYNSPRKTKYCKKIRVLTAQNKMLRNKIEELSKNYFMDTITLEQYQTLTFKYCESTETANFVNIQVSQGRKLPRGRLFKFQGI